MCYTIISNTEGVDLKYMENIMAEEIKEEVGITETQELMAALKSFVAECKLIMADKKVSFAEALGIMPEALKVITEGKDYKLIMDELQDLSGDEAKAILCDLVDTIFATTE